MYHLLVVAKIVLSLKPYGMMKIRGLSMSALLILGSCQILCQLYLVIVIKISLDHSRFSWLVYSLQSICTSSIVGRSRVKTEWAISEEPRSTNCKDFILLFSIFLHITSSVLKFCSPTPFSVWICEVLWFGLLSTPVLVQILTFNIFEVHQILVIIWRFGIITISCKLHVVCLTRHLSIRS